MYFETVKLFRSRIEVEIPCDFVDMPDYVAKKKYPSKHRPPVILMSRDTAINYSFNLMDVPLKQEDMMRAGDGFYINMKKMTPTGCFEDLQEITREDGMKVVSFSYEAPAVDEDIFGIIYLTAIRGKLLYGGFNCLLRDRQIWEDTAFHTIRSIREVEQSEN